MYRIVEWITYQKVRRKFCCYVTYKLRARPVVSVELDDNMKRSDGQRLDDCCALFVGVHAGVHVPTSHLSCHRVKSAMLTSPSR